MDAVSKATLLSGENTQSRKPEPIVTFETQDNACMAKVMVEMDAARGYCNTLLVHTNQTAEEIYSKIDWNSYTKSDISAIVRATNNRTYEHNRSPKKIKTCENCYLNSFVQGEKAWQVEMTAEDDWQRGLVNPVQRLTQIFGLRHLADVTITFENSSQVFKAHRLILASASPVFERMFYGNTKEATTGVVCLQDQPDSIKWLLENLYTGKTDLVNVMTAIMVYIVAQKYQISGISSMCKDFLKYEVSLNNVSEIFEIALTHSEECLINACVTKLCDSWPDVLNEHIADMTEEIWMHMLRKEVLPTSEVQLFNGLVIWGKAQLEIADESVSPENIRKRINNILRHVRLLSIPSDKFIDYVMPTNIFTPDECSVILMKLRGFPAPLPKTVLCSTIHFSRVDTDEASLRFIVLNRQTDNRKFPVSSMCEVLLLRNFSVSSSILIHQIQTQDNATLKSAQLTITNTEGHQVGVARALGSSWRFVKHTFLHANKNYSFVIDKVLVNKVYVRRDFCVYSSDIKFKGSTGDNYLRLSFWPASIKS